MTSVDIMLYILFAIEGLGILIMLIGLACALFGKFELSENIIMFGQLIGVLILICGFICIVLTVVCR